MLSGRPCVGEARAVVIADDVVLVTFGRRPAGPGRRAVRKVPGEQKCVARFGARSNVAPQAQRTGNALLFGFRSKLAIRR